MECLILEAISIHMEDKKVIRTIQHGFTKATSTLAASVGRALPKSLFTKPTHDDDETLLASIVYQGQTLRAFDENTYKTEPVYIVQFYTYSAKVKVSLGYELNTLTWHTTGELIYSIF
ncbi:hypothetical protein WISP_113384 [Willisornis vidua]|uniref:Uncharacterized protein n=1 Tax=Willisornis vidua TaxID=1566151 RepID=A0ABQ9CXS4_9PASS|nr:hypothetical protein WISP_113384 [Willisornis vidua]